MQNKRKQLLIFVNFSKKLHNRTRSNGGNVKFADGGGKPSSKSSKSLICSSDMTNKITATKVNNVTN